jgi:hypothetical protein
MRHNNVLALDLRLAWSRVPVRPVALLHHLGHAGYLGMFAGIPRNLSCFVAGRAADFKM